jgi:sec-independent protein translocase protein TatC
MFELPMIIYFLTKVGFISSSFLKKYRKHAVIIILTVSAIITPPDVLSMILVWMPIMALYEGSVLIAKRVERKKLKEK